MKRIRILLLLALCTLAPLALSIASATPFAGTITPQGYFPPAGVTVLWRTPGQPDVTKRLDPSVLFTSLGDFAGYLCRYAECDQTMVGRQIVPYVTGEHGGGEGFGILQELLRQAGLTRDPSLQEFYDWMVANGGGRTAFTCADFTSFTGHPRPGCVDIVPGGGGDSSKLRPQPSDPPGCCHAALPCSLRNEPGRANGEEWTEAVATPQGSRKGCRLRNTVEGPPPPVDPPPVEPLPDAAACEAFVAPLRTELQVCAAAAAECGMAHDSCLKSLDSRDRVEIPALKVQVSGLEQQVAGLQGQLAAKKPPLPAELATVLKDRKAAARGLGERALAGRAIRAACAVYVCPPGL